MPLSLTSAETCLPLEQFSYCPIQRTPSHVSRHWWLEKLHPIHTPSLSRTTQPYLGGSGSRHPIAAYTFTQTDIHNYFHIMSFQPTTINIEIMKYIWNKADLNVLAHLFHTNNFINVLIRTVLQLWLIWLSIDCSGILVQEIVFSFSFYTVHRQSFLFCLFSSRNIV